MMEKELFFTEDDDILLYKKMGQRLREIRKQHHWSQEKVAEYADISASYFGHIERGTRKASVMTLYKLAEALDVSTDFLLGRDADTQRQAAGAKG